MKRIVAMVLAAAALTGCVSRNMNEGLQSLVGQDIHAAVARLGYPNAKREMLGDTIYVWGSSQNSVMPMTTTNYTTGMVGTVPITGATTSTEFVPVNYNCSIQIATDSSGTIKNWQWSGNMGGCAHYARALKP